MEKVIFRSLPEEMELVISHSQYYIVKDRDSGERDLAALVDKERIEGCWAFTPHNNSWYNLGYETISETNEEGFDERGVYAYSMDFSQMGQKVSHYHIHTRFTEEEMLTKSMSELEEKLRPVLKDPVKRMYAIIGSTPSVTDIKSSVEIVKQSPGCQVDFKIVTPYGLVTLTFADTVEIDSAAEKYAQVHKESQLESVPEKQSVDEAISSAIDYINQQMDGLLTLEMDFREGL